MLDFIGELGGLDPWLWRGWAYLFSSSYRAKRHARWAAEGRIYALADIVFSLAIMALEIYLVVVFSNLALENFGSRR
ncbi:hypothetical protein [Xanthomonas sp. SI]|uniref:hypothetical protein n=1 Tax=Xanthomonas sp. SI TaxID=2724123 RepID=UPI001639AC90|nr:hypothetical protein [Xanthomonas sp. SI]QNH12166.1 hypothetical protein HEP75_01592 [Xanthomonas sp. SI]